MLLVKCSIPKLSCIWTSFRDFVEFCRFLQNLLKFREKCAIISMIEISVLPCFTVSLQAHHAKTPGWKGSMLYE